MNAKKVLLGSLVFAGLFSACTNDEILVDNQNDEVMSARPQVDLTLTSGGVDSRMSKGEGYAVNFTENDVLGAVLVDAGYTSASTNAANMTWNNVDWNIVDGHVGNNKWAYNATEGIFETTGTTAVGAWLFYTKYNEKMTTTRNGVEFHFPQIQDGAADYEKMANNNINFMISPIVNIDGYEGQKLNFDIDMNSVFNYLNMKFDFSALSKKVNKVQKIIVSSTQTVGGVSTPVKFPLDYKVQNTNVPVAAMSTNSDAIAGVAVPCYESSPCRLSDLEHQNLEMARKAAAFRYDSYSSTETNGIITVSSQWDLLDGGSNVYNPAVAATANAQLVEFLVVDFESEHSHTDGVGGLALDADGKFSAYMLMPAGVYENLTFDIYTDNGVYTTTVGDRNAYRHNIVAPAVAPNPRGIGKIFLRPNKVAVLSDIENAIKSSNEEFIKIITAKAGDTSTKTPDLINFIKGINAVGTYTLTVVDQDQIGGNSSADDAVIPAHSTVINKAVMDAIVTKEAALGGDIQLVLQGYNNMNVVGEATEAAPLTIHDITFMNGCTVTEGYVKATSDLGIALNKKMLVKNGASVNLALTSAIATLPTNNNHYFAGVDIERGAVVKVTKTSTIGNIANKGSLTVEKDGNATIILTSDEVTNQGTAELKSKLNVRTKFENSHYTENRTTYHGVFTNNGEMTIEAGVTANNNCTLNNNQTINVEGTFNNNAAGVIVIAETGKIHVNSTGSAILTNRVGGTITNDGMLYTKVGYDNTIVNLGTINANAGSTTYITKNSDDDESVTDTENNTMGTVKLAERNLDITVTKANNQGYIQYEVKAADIVNGKFDSKETPLNQKDKYNKVVFSNAAELTSTAAQRIKYITTNKDLVLPTGAEIQEVTFTGTASLYSEKARIAKLTVNSNVLVKIPTENVIGVYDVDNTVSKTLACIHNYGEILVGGDLYTSISGAGATTGGGEFSAGDGNDSAFHWNTPATNF